jgi:hypothetical protein
LYLTTIIAITTIGIITIDITTIGITIIDITHVALGSMAFKFVASFSSGRDQFAPTPFLGGGLK